MSNPKKVAHFYKVSFDQFVKDWENMFVNGYSEQVLRIAYASIPLPKRGTVGSAGYDFITPIGFTLEPGDEITIPTGISAKIKSGWVLMIFPRSGLGFKYGIKLLNTVGIVDQDYFFAENEGHILIKIKNEGDKPMYLQSGDRIVQGVFLPFGITKDDDATEKRTGGFGSTGR